MSAKSPAVGVSLRRQSRADALPSAFPVPLCVAGFLFRITLPLHIVSVANLREHWSAKARRAKAHRRAALAIRKGDYLPCIVTLTRIAPRSLDGDNLQSGLKNLRDGIADRLGINDNDPRCVWRYDQCRGKPREYAVIIEITSPNKPPCPT